MTDTDSVAIFAALTSIETKFARSVEINEVLLGRLTDTTHLTLDEIARLQSISKTSARTRYGRYLEEIPGTRKRGVPRQRVLDGWTPRRQINAAKRREKKASAQS